MRFSSGVLVTVSAALMASGASAETLPVAGVYAANEDAAAEVNRIVIDTFGGEIGERLAFATEDRLRTSYVGGEPWFDVSLNGRRTNVVVIINNERSEGQRGAQDDAAREAVLRGTTSLDVTDEASGTKDVRECVERDAKDKCIRRETLTYKCRTRAVMLRPDMRLIAGDGRTVYAMRDQRRAEQRYCADEQGEPSTNEMIEALVEEIAAQVRFDLVPVERAEDVRVLESRSGIIKEDRNAFRDAVKLVNRDPYGACQAFAALEANNLQDVSVLFNIGLCHESEGDLGVAKEYYSRALAISSKDYAVAGMDRIASRYRAQEQMARHAAQ